MKIDKEYVRNNRDFYTGKIQVDADELNELLTHTEELTYKLLYLFSNNIISEDGIFCFPDGDQWECKKSKV